jgi:hypothetical protein
MMARVDHAQLTAKVIADNIREDMEKDISLPIKQVRGLIRKYFRVLIQSIIISYGVVVKL